MTSSENTEKLDAVKQEPLINERNTLVEGRTPAEMRDIVRKLKPLFKKISDESSSK